MKLIIALTLAVCSIISQQPQASVELDEAVKLMAAGKASFQNSEYKEAINSVKRALEIRDRLLPADSDLIDESLSYLGQLYLLNYQYGDAKKTLQRLLERREQKVGPEHESLTVALDTLGAANLHLRNYDDAEAFYLRSLKIKEKKFGPGSLAVAGHQYAIGEMYRVRRKFKEALDSYTQALVLMGKFKETRPDQFEKVKIGYQCSVYETSEREKLTAKLKELETLLAAVNQPTLEKKFAEVLNGKALSLPAPKFPSLAFNIGAEGRVVVKVLIDEEGKVIDAFDLCQGSPYFSSAAIQAALQARFSATKVDGVPIKIGGVIVYNFRRR